MNDIRVKTNGYELTAEHKRVLKVWEEKAFETMDIKYIDEFYYGDKLVMAKIKLNDGYYGSFNITEKRISFNGHECTREEHNAFTKLTWNDECYKGELFQNDRKG